MSPDQSNLLSRLKSALPSRWFPDTTPILDGLLNGLAATWATLFQALAALQAQTRISTATDLFLDLAATDYFGANLRRALVEPDAIFRARLQREFLREHATKAALVTAVTEVTGAAPVVFEFARPSDTGAYGMALGYGAAGAWGSLLLPYQALVTTMAPPRGSIRRLTRRALALRRHSSTAGPPGSSSISGGGTSTYFGGCLRSRNRGSCAFGILPGQSTMWCSSGPARRSSIARPVTETPEL